MRALSSILSIAFSVVVIDYILTGVVVENIKAALLAGVVLWLAHKIVKPILVILTLPITIITVGLFIFVINATLFYVAAAFVPGFAVRDFFSACIGAIILSVIQAVLLRK